jgi:hypothetical protein
VELVVDDEVVCVSRVRRLVLRPPTGTFGTPPSSEPGPEVGLVVVDDDVADEKLSDWAAATADVKTVVVAIVLELAANVLDEVF